ncbi:MAG: trp operon repressor [Holosporales bacterium]|jgi:TrpR-related protein YerC/YecD|nr:trp operon repressor [Holosporales bacterium]
MKSLFEAVLRLENVDEVEKFFIDLCTLRELKTLKERWEVCQFLNSGQLSYREISVKTGASTTTITRVARFLKNESFNGYRCVLDKIDKDHGDDE